MGTPLFMRDVELTLTLVGPPAGTAASYACDVTAATIETSPGDEVTVQTLCADGTHTSISKSTYALHLVATQQWAADGLAAFLWQHEGELATFTYQAHGDDVVPSADAPGMMGEVRLVAGNYGGEADTYAELDVTLPCSGKPTMVTAAFPAADAESAKRTKAALARGGEQEPRRGDRRQGMSARAQGERFGAGVADSHGGAQAGGRGLASRRGAPSRRAGPARSRARGRRAPPKTRGPKE